MKETIVGILAFHISVKVEDMKKWTPERIGDFFAGVADALRAAEGETRDTQEQPQ